MSIHTLFYETLHLSLDDKALKIAQVKMVSGKKLVTGLFYKNIEGLERNEIISQIRIGVTSFKSTVKSVSMVLPAKYAITKCIEVPSLDKDEIENIIRLQAIRHTPYSKQEVIIGHVNLERILERYTKVLLVIVANENVRSKTDLVELAGYDIESVRLSSDSLLRFLNDFQLFGDTAPPFGLAFLDTESTDLIILNNGKPYYVRNIPTGLAHLEKDAASNKQLADEFKKTLEAYQNEDQGQVIKKFFILGTNAPAFFSALKDTNLVSADSLVFNQALFLSTESEASAGNYKQVNFYDVMADGLAQSNPIMDLLPEDLKVRKSFRQKGKEIFVASIFVLVILVLMLGVFLTKIYFRNNYLNQITKNFETKQKEAEELDRISEETRFAREFTKKRGISVKVLDEFQKILPEDMYLAEMALTEDNRVSIKGTSNLMSTVFAFVTELENSPQFKNVTSDYAKSRKENEKDVSDFGLSAVLEEA